MIQQTSIENENEIACLAHKCDEIVQILVEGGLKPSQRLMCKQCILERESLTKTMNFGKARDLILQSEKKMSMQQEALLNKQVEQVKDLQNNLGDLSTSLHSKLQGILNQFSTWNNELQNIFSSHCHYNFFDGIEHVIEQNLQNLEETHYQRCVQQFQELNTSYYDKISSSMQDLQSFQLFDKCNDALQRVITNNSEEQQNRILFKVEQSEKYVIQIYFQSTPKLNIQCNLHNRDIITVDITKEVEKGMRTACIDCQRKTSIPVVDFFALWKDYDDKKNSKLKEIREIAIKDINQIRQQLQQLKIDFTKEVNDLQGNLEAKAQQKLIIPKVNTDIKNNEDQIELLQQMAEELSKPKFQRWSEQEKISFQTNYEMQLIVGQKIQSIANLFRKNAMKVQEIITQSNNCQFKQPIKYQLVCEQKQKEMGTAMAFNHQGTTLVAGCGKNIKVWDFQKNKLIESAQLQGHQAPVSCLIYSKSINWFISGSADGSLISWKEIEKNWVGSEQQQMKQHLFCGVINQTEDQFIAGGSEWISVWNINQQTNSLQFQEFLEKKHSSWIISMQFNQLSTLLVSYSKDKLIIIWDCKIKNKWQMQSQLRTENFGQRLCFFNDYQFTLSEQVKGVINFYEIDDGKIIHKQNLKITFNTNGEDKYILFPSQFNQEKQLMIYKHNQYVYLVEKQINDKYRIEANPIDCESQENYGALTKKGDYLVIWNSKTQSFRLYKLYY